MLGIGGVRALRALGLEPTVWHVNEGHAAFLVLERLRERMREGIERHFYSMSYRERNIWGVTAGILRNLHERLYS